MRARRGENGRGVKRLVWIPVAVAVILGGCSRVDTVASSSSSGVAAPRHSWTRPGLLRIGSILDPDTLSPLLGTFQIDVDLSMFWAGYLFNYSDENRLVPELATLVPSLTNHGISKDGLTITYHLRKGVRWHDGAPFDAADVVFTWHAVMNPNNNVQTRTGYDDIVTIDTPDPYTAVVHLRRPFAPFVNSFFTMGSTPYPIYPKHLLAQYHDLNRIAYNSKPVGTGPFVVQEWHRGQTLRMVANPHYWRGAPKLKVVEYHIIPDENTLTTSMRAHEIDLWYNASAPNYPTASKIAGAHALLTPFTQYSQLGFNVSRPVLRDPNVRRALAYATDRKSLIEKVAFNVHVLGEGDQPAFLWAHDPQLEPIPFDPDHARKILDDAGWRAGSNGIRVKDGQPLRLEFATTSGSALGNRAAVFLQANWHDVGVDLVIKPYAPALMFANYSAGGILQAGKFDVEFSSWVNGVDPDDSTVVMCDQIPPHGQNIFRFCNHELDDQERTALTYYDLQTRQRAYARVQAILVDRLPWITMWFQRRLDVVSDDLRGYNPAHAVTPFWNTWEYSI